MHIQSTFGTYLPPTSPAWPVAAPAVQSSPYSPGMQHHFQLLQLFQILQQWMSQMGNLLGAQGDLGKAVGMPDAMAGSPRQPAAMPMGSAAKTAPVQASGGTTVSRPARPGPSPNTSATPGSQRAPAPPSPGRPPAGSQRAAAPAPLQAPSRPSGGRVDNFTFSSKPGDPDRIGRALDRHKSLGQTSMVGIDPNHNPTQQGEILRVAREKGAKTHLYLEGRGGPTGGSGWESSEWRRTQRAAASLNPPIQLTSQSDSSPGMREWNRRGWQEHSIRQAREARGQGFDSVEVDNINRMNGDNVGRTLEFYRRYAGEYSRGDMPTLMMKNHSLDELKAISKEMQAGRIPREMFSDFHIFENDSGGLSPQIRALTESMGIRTVISNNTYSYRASHGF